MAKQEGEQIVKLSFVRFGMSKLPNIGVGGMVRRINCVKMKASYVVKDTEDLKGLYGAIRNIKKSDLGKVNSGILKDTHSHIIRQGYCLPEDERAFSRSCKDAAVKEWEDMKASFDKVDADWQEYKANS